MAFVSFIAFANGLTNWLGYLIGIDDLSCEMLIAKLFIPLSYIIGVPWEDCENIGKVIATKTIVNEFVAYQRLGELKATGQVSVRFQYKLKILFAASIYNFYHYEKFDLKLKKKTTILLIF